MQTHFSLVQLADPDIREADRILRACVHCGFCLATCPTYVLLGDERDSPRGRIYLIKDMLEKDVPASATVTTHVDRCLSCLACMTACPSGVHYGHLVDIARARIARTHTRPRWQRLLQGLLAFVLPRPGVFRIALAAGRAALPLAPVLPGPLRAMVQIAARRRRKGPRFGGARVFAPEGRRRGRVALLAGCVQNALAPEINAATVRLLNRLGMEVVVAKGTGCCGALVHHMGREAAARDSARANIAAWTREIEGAGLDAIVVNASGCGTMVKDYGFLLRGDPTWAAKAARVAALARDVSEVVPAEDIRPAGMAADLTVAYHSACSLRNGQGIDALPRRLLAAAGFTLREVPEGHLCCGSAGTYNLMQPDLAATLARRKAANIDALGVGAVAAGNIGCMVQISGVARTPVVHTVELLDWATGGPKPPALDGKGPLGPGPG